MIVRQTQPLAYDQATKTLRKAGSLLIALKTSLKGGDEYFIVPGGPVSRAVARRILQHPDCREADAGLLPGIPQSWSLYGDKTR